MKKLLVGMASALALTACGVVTEGGAGKTSSGEPVSGLISLDRGKREWAATISSPAGWACETQFKQSNTGRMQVEEPLTCNNGETGTIILTINQTQQQMTGNFQLSDGKSGQVVFGNT